MKKRIMVFALMFVLSMQFAFAATTNFDVVTLSEKSMTVTFYDSEDPSLEGFETYDNDTGDGTFSFEMESDDVSEFDIKANVDGPHMDNIIMNYDGYETGKCYKLELFSDVQDISEKSCSGEDNKNDTGEPASGNQKNNTQTNETDGQNENNENSQENASNGQKNEQASEQKSPSQNQDSFLSGFLTSGSGGSNNSFFRTAFYIIAGILVLWIILFIFRTVLAKKEKKPEQKKVKVTKLSDLKSKLEKDRQKVSENKKTLNESIKEAEESIEKAQEAIYNLRKQQDKKDSKSDKGKKSDKDDD